MAYVILASHNVLANDSAIHGIDASSVELSLTGLRPSLRPSYVSQGWPISLFYPSIDSSKKEIILTESFSDRGVNVLKPYWKYTVTPAGDIQIMFENQYTGRNRYMWQPQPIRYTVADNQGNRSAEAVLHFTARELQGGS